MTLQSPADNALKLIEGDPGTITSNAKHLTDAAVVMERCADRLQAIGDGATRLKSEGITEIRKAAGEVHPDLRKAAKRYSLTGVALKTYAVKLDEVQNQMTSGGADNYTSLATLISDIDEAHETAESKKSEKEAANEAVNDADGLWGFSEGTPEELQQAKDDRDLASQASEDADAELNKLWGHFDARVSYWETAFDTAVDEIDDAFETAGNQDRWYDHAADILSIAGMVLFVVAIVATGPIAVIAAALAVVVGIASLGIEIYKMMIGDGDWTSLIIAGVSILPFGKFAGKGFKLISKSTSLKGFAKNVGTEIKGVKNFRLKLPETFGKTKGMVRDSVGNKLPVAYTKPTGSTMNRMKTMASNEWNEIVHPYRQWKAGRKFVDGYENKFQDRQFAERFESNIVLGYKESRNHVLAGHIMDNAETAGPKAVEWATQIQQNLTHDQISGSVNFLSGTLFNTYGAGQTADGWQRHQ